MKVAPVPLLFHPYLSYQHYFPSTLDNLYTHSTIWAAIKAFPNKSQKKTTIMPMWIALTTTRPFDPCLRRELMVTIWRAERTPKATSSKRSSARPTAAHLREARKANSEAIKTARAERTIRAGCDMVSNIWQMWRITTNQYLQKILFVLSELSHNLTPRLFLHPVWLRVPPNLRWNFASSVDCLVSEYNQSQ